MGEQDLYFQNILNKQFSITAKDSNGEESTNEISTGETASNELLLSIQDRLLDELPNGKTASIEINSGENQLAEINLSPINEFMKKLDKLKGEIDKVDQIDQKLTTAENYMLTYNDLQKTYEEKVDALEYKINHNFGKANNSIHKEQNSESVVTPEIFEKISKKEGTTIRTLLKKSYKKLFQSTKPQSKAAEQNKNNTVSAKLNLRKNFIKQLRGQTSATNPEQLAEELILSLLKPLKGINASLTDYHQQKKNISSAGHSDSDKSNKMETSPSGIESNGQQHLDNRNLTVAKPEFSLSANAMKYDVIGYSEDFSKLELRAPDGKRFQAPNSKGLRINPIAELKLNPIQKELLTRGKTLMITSGTNLPYKISVNEGKGANLYDVTTVSMDQFKNNKKMKATAVKTVKHKL